MLLDVVSHPHEQLELLFLGGTTALETCTSPRAATPNTQGSH